MYFPIVYSKNKMPMKKIFVLCCIWMDSVFMKWLTTSLCVYICYMLKCSMVWATIWLMVSTVKKVRVLRTKDKHQVQKSNKNSSFFSSFWSDATNQQNYVFNLYLFFFFVSHSYWIDWWWWFIKFEFIFFLYLRVHSPNQLF